jgi:hypothetical protein
VRHAISIARLYRYASASGRCLPDFVIAGAGKSGTTSLWQYLAEHPNVASSTIKEVHFFNRNFHRGINWYRAHFPLATVSDSQGAGIARKITGDATPSYLYHPLVPERLAAVIPNVKILLLLRNPVDRTFSHYQLKIKRRQEKRAFDEAIESQLLAIADTNAKIANGPQDASGVVDNRFPYIDHSLYINHILRWERFFPSSQFLIIESSEFFQQTESVYMRVLDFLGLPSWKPGRFGNRYPGNYSQRLPAESRRRLAEFFAPHNSRLYSHLGRRFDWDSHEATAALNK